MRDYCVGTKDLKGNWYHIKYVFFHTYTEAYIYANRVPKREHKHEVIIAHRLYTGSMSQWRDGAIRMNVIYENTRG